VYCCSFGAVKCAKGKAKEVQIIKEVNRRRTAIPDTATHVTSLKKHRLTFFQALIGTYSNSTLGIYQVVIYSKQAYTCDFTRLSTSGFTYELLPGCNLAHWRQ